MSQRIQTCLWFDNNAEEAVNFYILVFPNSKILTMSYYTENMPGTPGDVLMVSFQMEGQEFLALNGGPHFTFSPAISLYVNCETQEEIDTLWEKLLADGGKESECGWLTDKFGLSWQIVPSMVQQMISDPDPARSNRVMQAIMKMVKLDLATLKRAYEGE